MSHLIRRLSNLHKTNKFTSNYKQETYSNSNPILQIGLEAFAQKVAKEIVDNLEKGMSPELAASIPFKKYSGLLKPFLSETVAERLGDRIIFYLNILLLQS